MAALAPDVAFAQRSPPAPAPKVILLRPPAAPAAVSEALVRLQAELTVEGFDAQVTEFDLGADVRASLEKVAPTMAATAVVAVVAGADPASAELWVVDRMTGKTVVRRVHADPKATARIAEVLSVRAVELLRASFLELAITSRPAPDVVEVPLPTEPVVTRFVTEPLEEAEPDWTWAVEAGARRHGRAPGRVGRHDAARRVPAGRARAARVQRAAVRARVVRGAGDAGAGRSAGRLRERVADHRARRRRWCASGAGGGWSRWSRSAPASCYLTAEGHESAPYIGGNAYRVSAAADAGVGLRMPLRPRRVELGVEVHALLAEPYPVVRFFADRGRARRAARRCSRR